MEGDEDVLVFLLVELAQPLPSQPPPFKKRHRKGDKYNNRILKTLLRWYRWKQYLIEAEYLELQRITGLTLVQLKNWFANARRRKY